MRDVLRHSSGRHTSKRIFCCILRYTMKPSSVIYRERERKRERERTVSEKIVIQSQPHSRFKRLTFPFFLLSPFFFKHPAFSLTRYLYSLNIYHPNEIYSLICCIKSFTD